MRIAYIINSLEGGGAAFPVPAILSLMRSYGAEVKVFALLRKDGKALLPLQQANIPVSIREGGLKDHLPALTWLNQQIQNYRPTHLWTSLTRATLLGQLVGKHRRLPVTSWQHAAYLKPWNLRLLKATKNLSQLWIGDSQRITALTKQRLGIPDEKIITWPIFKALPYTKSARPWQAAETIKVASMGRLHPVKGYDVLIQAVRCLQQKPSIPPYKIFVYGEGAEHNDLQALIEQYRLQNYIELVGFTNDVNETLSNHHLYVQPSRSEGFCVAAHEAMQAGLPVIASAVGELPFSIQNNQTGLIVPPNDPQALAEALYSLLSIPNQLYTMGQTARDKVLNDFSTQHFETIGRNIFDQMNSFTKTYY
ncbi:glycosyltransferase [Commensalibacter oyaizuii]|uniref:Glycosyltransferase n=1 Tax=Commensalibacter oyaizuii TaxID=3043873 RepID=A0ABT6Q1M5_9PROT|nr:glycosyltransferase [Commensalibacter sp. TBRC 16381]MDI2091010.1 glycosyltransferase [Commensalibacter sp. TBRC 16381]